VRRLEEGKAQIERGNFFVKVLSFGLLRATSHFLRLKIFSKQNVKVTDRFGMNQNISGCKRCDQLLTEFGEAVLHFTEIKKSRGQSESGEGFGEYRSAQSECQRLRFLLLLHLNQHELEVSVKDSTVGEADASSLNRNQTRAASASV
jgi:hypothetical protein